LQHWFNLSDPAVEEALYDSQAMVCHERTDGRRCDAVQEMGVGPSEAAPLPARYRASPLELVNRGVGPAKTHAIAPLALARDVGLLEVCRCKHRCHTAATAKENGGKPGAFTPTLYSRN
jgi:hypothetical protein